MPNFSDIGRTWTDFCLKLAPLVPTYILNFSDLIQGLGRTKLGALRRNDVPSTTEPLTAWHDKQIINVNKAATRFLDYIVNYFHLQVCHTPYS